MAAEPSHTVRYLTIDGLPEAAEALFQAFRNENAATRIPIQIDIPSVEEAAELLHHMTASPSARAISVVQTSTGKLEAGGYLHLGETVHSIGPVFVHPDFQKAGVGRLLMQNLLKESKSNGGENVTSVRLSQAAPNQASFSLYFSLGFVPVECTTMLYGTFDQKILQSAAASLGILTDGGVETRQMEEADIKPCSELFTRAGLGYSREAEITSLFHESPRKCWVALRGETIEAYTTGLNFFGHSIASNEEALVRVLIAAGPSESGEGSFFLPTRLYPNLLRWALASKLRVARHSWYMVLGQYKPPSDSFIWLPNVLH